jgi:MATE family multidrug resistance protein
VPIAASQAGLALMGLIDTAVVGRLGAGPLGAVGLANGLFFGLAVVGIGVMLGLDPLLSQAIGARDERRARELLWQSAWLAALLTALLSLPIALLPLLLRPAGIAAALIPDARGFLLWRIPGLFPLFAFAGVRSYLQSRGMVRRMLIAIAVANLCNLGLDVLFVFGWGFIPAFGAPGAGIATSLCSFVMWLILVAAARDPQAPRVARRPVRADLWLALRVGAPVGLQMGAEVSVFALVGVLAGRLGALPMAAHQIALALASFTFCAAVGVGQAGSVRVGWAIGAGDSRGARRAGLVAFAGGASVMAVSALAFLLAPAALARMLSDQQDVIAAAVPLLAVCAVFQISDGVQAVGAGVLRGAGDTHFAFWANVFGHYLIGLPVAIWLGVHLGGGVIGLWWGLCVGLTSVAIALLSRFVRLAGRELKALEQHPRPPGP